MATRCTVHRGLQEPGRPGCTGAVFVFHGYHSFTICIPFVFKQFPDRNIDQSKSFSPLFFLNKNKNIGDICHQMSLPGSAVFKPLRGEQTSCEGMELARRPSQREVCSGESVCKPRVKPRKQFLKNAKRPQHAKNDAQAFEKDN